ncbi:unnamed protein product [Oikopleura dioica]|uniref:Uncharacterized protein n=1 Tax=Oikopleura dioica TaxID=34765 RepID=E4Z0Y9_OIKDI|nr:unnamed protein product [Oikopleura dioica]
MGNTNSTLSAEIEMENRTINESWTEAIPVFFNYTDEDEPLPRSLDNFNETLVSNESYIFANETIVNGTTLEFMNDTIDGRRFVPAAIPDLTPGKNGNEAGKTGFVFLFGLAGIIILIGIFLKIAKRCGKYRKNSEDEYRKLSAHEKQNKRLNKL